MYIGPMANRNLSLSFVYAIHPIFCDPQKKSFKTGLKAVGVVDGFVIGENSRDYRDNTLSCSCLGSLGVAT